MRIYITTCDKKLNYANCVKRTLANCPHECLFVYGRGNHNKVHPHIEFDFEESYDNLPEKTYRLIEHFVNTSKDEYLVKIDDDTLFDWKKLIAVQSDYVGGFVNWGHSGISYDKEKYFEWYQTKLPNYKELKKQYPIQYAEGGFYILSRKACIEILKYKSKFCGIPNAEDTLVGICLKDPSFTKSHLELETELVFDVAKNGTFIHPVNLLLFSMLEGKSHEERVSILKQYHYFVPPKYKS